MHKKAHRRPCKENKGENGISCNWTLLLTFAYVGEYLTGKHTFVYHKHTFKRS
jgi:hypothetical protein